MIWHDFYVILGAHPEIPGSIHTLGLSFLFSSQTAPMWLTDGFSFGGWSLLAASPVVRETPAMEQGNERETPASERRTECEA